MITRTGTGTSIAEPACDTESLRLRDGRTLAYRRYGLPGGAPVYCFHGLPGSAVQAALVHEDAAMRGIELTGFDRPGFGRSSPCRSRTIRALAADVAELADHLGHRRFSALGISCGGAYALACANELPERVARVGLLAGMGPMDIPAIRERQLPVLKLMFALARINRWLASPLLVTDRLLFGVSPAAGLRAISAILTGPDRRLLESNPRLRQRFGDSLTEAYRQGLGPVLTDARLIALPRGFELADVGVPVDVYQGGSDRHVPPSMGRYLAEQLPDARFHSFPEDGHLSIVVTAFPQWADVVAGGSRRQAVDSGPAGARHGRLTCGAET